MFCMIKRKEERREEKRREGKKSQIVRHLSSRNVNNMMEYRTKKVCLLKDHFSRKIN